MSEVQALNSAFQVQNLALADEFLLSCGHFSKLFDDLHHFRHACVLLHRDEMRTLSMLHLQSEHLWARPGILLDRTCAEPGLGMSTL